MPSQNSSRRLITTIAILLLGVSNLNISVHWKELLCRLSNHVVKKSAELFVLELGSAVVFVQSVTVCLILYV
jgi:hypothetical protein